MRGVVVSPTSSADWTQPAWAVFHLCEPDPYFPLNWGQWLYPNGEAQWRWSDPGMPAELYARIEQDVLPMLRGVVTLDDMVEFCDARESENSKFTVSWNLLRYLPLQVARGKLDSAREVLDRLLSGKTWWNAPDLADEFSVVDPLKPLLLADDRKGMAKLLHEWERSHIAALRMEHIWEPTPFPLQSAGVGDR